MEKKPLVSIVIATYDEEDHIANCINSLLNQNYPFIEIIITDDGSIDNTINIINEKVLLNSNIKLIKQEHLGMAQAWNNSFSNSSGEIIITIGADMVCGKEFVSDMIKPIIENGALGTYPIKEVIQNADNLWARVKGKERIYGDTTYLAIRRDAWINVGGSDTSRGYDADQTFYDKLKIKPIKVDTEIYHNHPATFKEFWKQSLWIGNSMKLKNQIMMLLVIPIIPFIILYKSLNVFIKDPMPIFILFLPFYNLLKYIAFIIGVFQYFIYGKRNR